MKFVTYSKDEEQYVGVLSLDEKKVYSTGEFLPGTEYKDMVTFIKDWKDQWREVIKEFLALKKDGLDIKEVKILAPIIKPPHDIISLGVNYQDHLEESRRSMKINTLHEIKAPVYFSKRTIEILGPEAEIQGHFELDKYLDYEVELAVIIGKKGSDIPKESVKDYIFGYSIFN
ncbi:MAG: fumarylacetoacetate hydrolase family protein, partial [Clostridia bacterium]|nr:fumarylacetoacetate hydrolase family protein [Clostridia bacterium]